MNIEGTTPHMIQNFSNEESIDSLTAVSNNGCVFGIPGRRVDESRSESGSSLTSYILYTIKSESV